MRNKTFSASDSSHLARDLNIRQSASVACYKYSKRLTLAFFLLGSVFLAGTAASALTVFSDGGTHVINDSSYRTNEISVTDDAAGSPTTLVFETGAVFDGEGSVLSVHGKSRVLFNGGQFGGPKLTGQVFAYDTASFEVHGGSFGGTRLGSGIMSAYDNAQVRVYGGTFGADGNLSGLLRGANNALIVIYGGSFGGLGGYSGAIYMWDNARIAIHGGSFQQGIVAGITAGNLFLSGNADAQVHGCNFAGYPAYGVVLASSGNLDGTLADGSIAHLPFLRADNSKLTLVNTCDSDGDGVPDVIDSCSHSDTRSTVIIGSCDSGVTNTLNASGCTLADEIAALQLAARNHGEFVSSVARFTNSLKQLNLLTDAEKAALQRCAARQIPAQR